MKMMWVLTKQWVMIIGGLAFILALVALWMEQTKYEPPKKLPGDLHSPILAMELVKSRAQVEQIIGDVGDPYRKKMKESLRKDSIFILAYGLLFIAMGLLQSQLGYTGAKWLGIAAIACAVGTAAFDLLENLSISKVIDLPLAETLDAMAQRIRFAALIKWTLFYFTIALLAPIFFWRWNILTLIGALFLSSFFIGLIGLFYHQLIRISILPVSVGLLAIAFIFTFCPEKILKGMC